MICVFSGHHVSWRTSEEWQVESFQTWVTTFRPLTSGLLQSGLLSWWPPFFLIRSVSNQEKLDPEGRILTNFSAGSLCDFSLIKYIMTSIIDVSPGSLQILSWPHNEKYSIIVFNHRDCVNGGKKILVIINSCT